MQIQLNGGHPSLQGWERVQSRGDHDNLQGMASPERSSLLGTLIVITWQSPDCFQEKPEIWGFMGRLLIFKGWHLISGFGKAKHGERKKGKEREGERKRGTKGGRERKAERRERKRKKERVGEGKKGREEEREGKREGEGRERKEEARNDEGRKEVFNLKTASTWGVCWQPLYSPREIQPVRDPGLKPQRRL